jgi:hypothetical protein
MQRRVQRCGLFPHVEHRIVAYLLLSGEIIILAIVAEPELVDHQFQARLAAGIEQVEHAGAARAGAAERRIIDRAGKAAGMIRFRKK